MSVFLHRIPIILCAGLSTTLYAQGGSNNSKSATIPVDKLKQFIAARKLNCQLVTDSDSLYDSTYFNYFIAPVRAKNATYPYVVAGNFDDNTLTDYALVVRENKSPKGRIKTLVILNNKTWRFIDEEGAISLYKKETLSSPYEHRKVKMKHDGILVEYFEKSALVCYWNGKSFSKHFISD